MRNCKMCKIGITGRRDKRFCSVRCKSDYHEKLTKVTLSASERIDKILHRNLSILLELMGKNGAQKKMPKIELDKKKFNWTYFTDYHINIQKKTVHYVYDFSSMVFSHQEVLIKRVSQTHNKRAVMS